MTGTWAASRGCTPSLGRALARATDSGAAGGRVRLYRLKALLQDLCMPIRSWLLVSASLACSILSSRAACSQTGAHSAQSAVLQHKHHMLYNITQLLNPTSAILQHNHHMLYTVTRTLCSKSRANHQQTLFREALCSVHKFDQPMVLFRHVIMYMHLDSR